MRERNLFERPSIATSNRQAANSTPNLRQALNKEQIDDLLSKVNMTNTFLKLGDKDANLIKTMKSAISY